MRIRRHVVAPQLLENIAMDKGGSDSRGNSLVPRRPTKTDDKVASR